MESSVDFDSCVTESSLLRQSNPLTKISPGENPEYLLFFPEEEDEQLSMFMHPEDIIKKWAEYHLKGTEFDTPVNNFTIDWTVCFLYLILFPSSFLTIPSHIELRKIFRYSSKTFT